MNAAFVVVMTVLSLLAWYDAARARCTVCHRGYAIWSIVGKTRRRMPVCWKCRQTHHALERSRR